MRSEVEFIEEVISSIHNPQSKLKNFDECRFSRIEAVTDDVYIPYYDATSIAKSSAGKISHFFPDFILQCAWNVFGLSKEASGNSPP